MKDRTTMNERPVVRRKLVVGPADDRYEREADRVAKRVVTEIAHGAPAPASGGGVARQPLDEEELAMKRDRRAVGASAMVVRQSLDEEELAMKRAHPGATPQLARVVRRMAVGADGGELDHATTARIDSSRGGGRPLDLPLRRSMETAFGSDFSNVRVHTGSRADQLNADLGARAFTTGSDVFVRSSDYRPDSHAGRELLAHELTHVVQQGGAPALETT